MSWKTVLRMAERGELDVAQKLPGPNGAYLFDAEQVQAKALEQVEAKAAKRAAGTLFEDNGEDGGVRS